MFADGSDAGNPKDNVAGNEEEENEDGRTCAHSIGDHEQPVEKSVDKGWYGKAEQQIEKPTVGVEFGQGEEITHEDAEEEMPGDGNKGTHDAGAQAPFKNVEDVFDAGKT